MSERGKLSDPRAAGTTTRRGVISWLWWGLGLAALAELGWVTAAFLRPRRRAQEEAPRILVAGAVDDFAPGSVTPFPAGKFYLVRLDDGGFLALDRECTHLGCTVPWRAEDERFECPCHASSFDLTGAVLNPPAPRPLDLHPVRIENGLVKVEADRRLRRTAFNPSQAVRS